MVTEFTLILCMMSKFTAITITMNTTPHQYCYQHKLQFINLNKVLIGTKHQLCTFKTIISNNSQSSTQPHNIDYASYRP